MQIIQTKKITPIELSTLDSVEFEVFKNRPLLHNGEKNIPPFFVYIHEYAWDAFINHGNNIYNDSGYEAQGILAGKYFTDSFGTFLVATKYFEGFGYSNSSFVSMTEECLVEIGQNCRKNGDLMLIWVHTHPNFGVFYSSTDRTCLKNNFFKPYQIGIVADIIRKQHKGFKIIDGEVNDFNTYSLYNDIKTTLIEPYSSKNIPFLPTNQTIDIENNSIIIIKKKKTTQDNQITNRNQTNKEKENISDNNLFIGLSHIITILVIIVLLLFLTTMLFVLTVLR